MKQIKASLLVLACAGVSSLGFASQYYYIGGNTADVSSWVEAVANPDHLWHTTTTIYEVGNPDIDPSDNKKNRTYQAASALPASGDVLMFIEKLTMIDKDGNTVDKTPEAVDMSFNSNIGFVKFFVSKADSSVNKFTLDASAGDITFTVSNDFGLNGKATTQFIANRGATSSAVNFSQAGGVAYLLNGAKLEIGSSENAFDTVSFSNVSWGNGSVDIYAKNISITRIQSYTSDCNITFHIEGLNDTAALSIGKYAADAKFVLDLSDVASDFDVSADYILATISSGSSFENYGDFLTINGLSAEQLARLNWDVVSQTLSLVGAAVPEPAAVAAILGLAALGFAAYRRRSAK